MNLDTDLASFMKIDSKWIIGQNIKCKNIKLLGDDRRENLGIPEFGNESLDTMLKACSMKEKIARLDVIKMKNLLCKRYSVKIMQRQAIPREKIFAKAHLMKDLYPQHIQNP